MLGRSDEWEGVASRITFTDDLRTAVEDVDLVVEAVTEDLEVKQTLFTELESICREDTILASNTSTFMPSQLAEATKNPSRVIVRHYFNPPHIVPLVEVVGGRETSPETVETVRDLLVSQGQEAGRAGDRGVGLHCQPAPGRSPAGVLLARGERRRATGGHRHRGHDQPRSQARRGRAVRGVRRGGARTCGKRSSKD